MRFVPGNKWTREDLLELMESRFGNPAFPVYVLASPAQGVLGESRGENGRQVSYSLRYFEGDPDGPMIEVETLAAGEDASHSRSGEWDRRLGRDPLKRWPDPPVSTSTLTLNVDGVETPTAVDVYETGWQATRTTSEHTIRITGDTSLPSRIDLTSTNDMTPFIREHMERLKRMIGGWPT